MSPSSSLQSTISQNDWSEGEVRDVAPELISKAGAYSMTDVFLDEDGNPYRRGGTKYVTPEGLGEEGLTWGWDGHLLPGARTIVASQEDFGVLSEEDKGIVNIGGAGLTKPVESAVLCDLLYIAGGTLYGGSQKATGYGTGTVSVTTGSATVTGSGTTWNTLVDAGMLFHISGRVYVVKSIDSTTQLTLRDAYAGTTATAQGYGLYPAITVDASNTPYGIWPHVTVCANRFVFASGRTIRFTEVNNPHSFTNSLGTVNQHEVPEGVEITGLRTLGQICLVFTTGGVWTLEGLALDITDLNGNAQHKIQQLSGDVVLAGPAGVAAYGQTLVVPAGDGVYLMDGVSQPRRISKPIERLYRQYIHDGASVGGGVVFNSHYFLPVSIGINNVKTVFVCRLDRPTRDRDQTIYPWNQLSGNALASSYFRRTATGPQEPRLLATEAKAPSKPMDCTGFFEPGRAIEKDADGTWADLDVMTRAYETGAETNNVLRKLRVLYQLTEGEEESRLELSYNDGSSKSTGVLWGRGAKWGEFQWGGDAAPWIPVGRLGPSDGRDPGKVKVNQRFRHVRIRIRSVGPNALCVLRALELKIRPSEAIRR